MNTATPALISLEREAPRTSNAKKRGILFGSLAAVGCAVACSIPLIAGAGALSLSAGALGGERAFFAVALLSLGVVTGVVWLRRRRAAKAAAAHAAATGQTPDACSTDHACAGSGCGCS